MTQDLLDDVDTASPEQLWRVFAPAIAGRPSVRLGRTGGTNAYGRRRKLTEDLPDEPAAVLLYDKGERTRCLAADFDVSKGRHLAAAEANVFAAWIAECGGRAIVDRSPTGGRHVYVLLETPRHTNIVRAVMHALKARFSTLDTLPMRNAATGAIRPPGARHRAGGHQQLVTPLQDAMEAVRHRNGDLVWRALLAKLGPVDLPAPRRTTSATLEHYAATSTRWKGRQYPLRPTYERIASTGSFDRQAHPSWTRSHARQAVLTAAFHAGWLLPEVMARATPHGPWRGLHKLFGGQRVETQMPFEWSIAEAFVMRSESLVRRSPTRDHLQTPPVGATHSEYAWLRQWWTAMRLVERRRYSGREGHSTRLVLRALAAMAQRRGTRYVSVGTRSLALACHLDHTTVARVLRELRDEADPLVDLVDHLRGHDRPDVYALRIPTEHERQASVAPWRTGRLDAIHPAFLELGVPAAFVYEALGERREPLRTVEIAEVAMLGRTAATQALKVLGEMGLAERGPSGWRRGPVDIDLVAEQLGAAEEFKRRVAAVKAERKGYAQWLREHVVQRAVDASPPHGEPPVDLWAVELDEPDPEHEVLDLRDVPASAREREVALAFNAELIYVGPGP